MSKDVAKREVSLQERLGEIDLNDAVGCAVLLDEIRQLEAQLGNAKARLTGAIVERAKLEGETAYDLPGRMRATISKGTRNTVAPDVLEQRLRDAGMPEARISTIVQQTVSHTVDLKEAKKAAGVNEAYAKALAEATTSHEAQPSVTIRRR